MGFLLLSIEKDQPLQHQQRQQKQQQLTSSNEKINYFFVSIFIMKSIYMI